MGRRGKQQPRRQRAPAGRAPPRPLSDGDGDGSDGINDDLDAFTSGAPMPMVVDSDEGANEGSNSGDGRSGTSGDSEDSAGGGSGSEDEEEESACPECGLEVKPKQKRYKTTRAHYQCGKAAVQSNYALKKVNPKLIKQLSKIKKKNKKEYRSIMKDIMASAQTEGASRSPRNIRLDCRNASKGRSRKQKCREE